MATTFDETKALALYYQHKTDTEIARGVGALTTTIKNWRKRKGLPNISPSARPDMIGKTHNQGGVDYRTTLTPEQAREMKRFLNTLLHAGETAKEAGAKPDVDRFMKAWRGGQQNAGK